MQHKAEDLENSVSLLLRQGPLTPDDVSTRLGISWGTAQNVLLRLTSKGIATVSRKGRVNVYFIGRQVASSSHTPSWAKARDLEDLSSELSKYFPKDESAAEMIHRERRRG
ncbi:MAG TPA: helix-turn-helix domain-containing protein [Nitrososphaerales archaeon]|nr:helix-turn-helix domain-containing protein [Nitrososphaerales archaeon]